MTTKTIRISVDLLEKLAGKFIDEGRPAEIVRQHIGLLISEVLWRYVGGEFKAVSGQTEQDQWDQVPPPPALPKHPKHSRGKKLPYGKASHG